MKNLWGTSFRGDVIFSARTSIVERCMEDQEGVRAFHRAAPRGEREERQLRVKAMVLVQSQTRAEALSSMRRKRRRSSA